MGGKSRTSFLDRLFKTAEEPPNDDGGAAERRQKDALGVLVAAMVDPDHDGIAAVRRNATRRQRAARDAFVATAGEAGAARLERALGDCGFDAAAIRSGPDELRPGEVEAACRAAELVVEHACTADEASDLYFGVRLVRRGQRLLSGALDAESTKSATYTADRGVALRDRAIEKAKERAAARDRQAQADRWRTDPTPRGRSRCTTNTSSLSPSSRAAANGSCGPASSTRSRPTRAVHGSSRRKGCRTAPKTTSRSPSSCRCRACCPSLSRIRTPRRVLAPLQRAPRHYRGRRLRQRDHDRDDHPH